MNDRPGWIQLLYKRGSAGHALHSGFLLNLTAESVAEVAASQPNGREELREVAMTELESDDSQAVALSLVYLGVVGKPEDLPAVDRFADHPSDLIRKAARACLFGLRQAARG
jgi:hypothetical protein